MRRSVDVGILALVSVGTVALLGAQYAQPTSPGQPAWAYAIAPPPPEGTPAAPPVADDGTVWRLPGTDRTFTRTQIRDPFGPADWYPGDHPPMPSIVANGRRPDARACAMCHYPNGKGRPENAGVAGLPVAYFIQQMHDFRDGLRKSAEARKNNTNTMIAIAKAMTDDEIKAAAEYFGSMKWTLWIRVVETNTVAKTRVLGGIHLPLQGAAAGTEPIGQRIVESPENIERAENQRDPRSGWVAYVPVGSIKKGEFLVTTGGNGKTVACGVCHGADLMGLGPVPGIAGRSPSYVVRQMYDMQQGARKGPWAELMMPVVQRLTNEDFVNIAAYAASRPVSTSALSSRPQ
jgi:cytochrome c553